MNLSELIRNDYFQLIGWIMTVIGGAIAIIQTIDNKKLKRENSQLKQQIQILNEQNSVTTSSTRDRTIAQGDSSQYIETSTGTINIKTGKK